MAIQGAPQFFQQANHIHFHNSEQVHLFSLDDIPSITYNSWADGHYINKSDQGAANLSILPPSTKQVAIANGAISHAMH